jgi:hypothetical protein
MKTLLLAGATVALLTAVNFAPAMAQGPKLSGGSTRADISQRVDISSANAATTTAHTSISTDTTSTEHGGAIGSWSASRQLIQKTSMSLQVPNQRRWAH